ncbi:hypothetical protein B0H14DRAFT_3082258 [Mycena olivaceomarginata]|nr:hypothetical protein B0H14DRAFT_3082258 [Mycena olivaceomarginata]
MTSAALTTLVFALLPAALAQTTHSVQVGLNGNTYDPPFITAAAGDTVKFTFHFESNVTALLDTWEFAVAGGDTPFWFHCEQTGHCGQGMVFAINAPADPDPHSFTAFQNRAKQLNGTGSASSALPSSTATDAYTTPPAQSWATATATVTHDGSTWTSVYTSYEGTPSPTYAPGAPVNHIIQVGIDGLNYTQPNITAAIGDTVTFEFHPKNHTVTQSSFLEPCKPLAETSITGQVGFKSGFQFVDPSQTTDFPTFTITINDTAPIWGYCGQQGPPVHCTEGMVFSINAVESGPNNFAAFQALAKRGGAAAAAGNKNASASAGAPSPSQSTGAAAVSKPLSYVSVMVLGAVGAVAALW